MIVLLSATDPSAEPQGGLLPVTIASFASVLTRSPEGRCSFDGAATTQRTPAAVNVRYNPKPVGPASYLTVTGPGSSAIHDRT
jgi:hypothetical protein